MATDYERRDPTQDYAERRGITFRARVVQIMRKLVPERVRDAVNGMLDGLRSLGDGVPGPNVAQQPERGTAGKAEAERHTGEDPQEVLRSARTRALVRHARAVDTIFAAQEQGGKASPEQVQELHEARAAFEDVRPYGSHDAEAAYKKNPELATEAASGGVNRAIRALQLETEILTDPQRRADRFVERWHELKHTGHRQYEAGNISGYKATKSVMGDMAKSLERDPQLESLLANRKRELGIGIESGRSLGRELAFTHGIDLSRGPESRTVELACFGYIYRGAAGAIVVSLTGFLQESLAARRPRCSANDAAVAILHDHLSPTPRQLLRGACQANRPYSTLHCPIWTQCCPY